MPDASAPRRAPAHPNGTSTAAAGLDDDLARLQLDDAAPLSAQPNGAATAAQRTTANGRLEAAEKTPPWLEGHPLQGGTDPQSRLADLDAEILSFVSWARPSTREHEFRLQVFALFERVVGRLWPGAGVELFGSMRTGLYLPHGDFDVVISHPPLERLPPHQPLHTLATALRTSRFASHLELILSAKVPLVKFTSAPAFGSFRFDVSFNSLKGVAGARESLRLLGELQDKGEGKKEQCKRLVMLFKAMLDARGLNVVKHGGLGGMSAFCLAVSFVQRDTRHPSEMSPGQDLLAFLEHYAFDFDYDHASISTANRGCLLSKQGQNWTNAKDPSRLSIQHPVDLDRDLSSGSHAWREILLFLRFVHSALEDALFSPSTPPPPSYLSILKIDFAPPLLKRRKANEDAAVAGTMERMEKDWVPVQVREDPVIARMRMNGLISASTPSAQAPQSVLYASPPPRESAVFPGLNGLQASTYAASPPPFASTSHNGYALSPAPSSSTSSSPHARTPLSPPLQPAAPPQTQYYTPSPVPLPHQHRAAALPSYPVAYSAPPAASPAAALQPSYLSSAFPSALPLPAPSPYTPYVPTPIANGYPSPYAAYSASPYALSPSAPFAAPPLAQPTSYNHGYGYGALPAQAQQQTARAVPLPLPSAVQGAGGSPWATPSRGETWR
ncbi:hypothetical protein JCM10207_009288 [Rhodosporidiobolus poonsookiae]